MPPLEKILQTSSLTTPMKWNVPIFVIRVRIESVNNGVPQCQYLSNRDRDTSRSFSLLSENARFRFRDSNTRTEASDACFYKTSTCLAVFVRSFKREIDRAYRLCRFLAIFNGEQSLPQ